MGSLFSSPAAADSDFIFSEPAAADSDFSFSEPAASDCNPPSKRERKEHDDLRLACQYAFSALAYYNRANPDAKYRLCPHPVKTPKAACVGFRQDFWYHVGFWACRVDDSDAVTAEQQPQQYLFAELRYDPRSRQLAVETCTILEMPLCRFRSGCAFCPDKFEILHPRDTKLFICGKKRHKKKFFRERYMLGMPFRARHAEQNFFC